MAGSVFFIHRQRVEVDPVHGTQGILHNPGPASALPGRKSLLSTRTQLGRQGVCAARNIQSAGQNTGGGNTSLNCVEHRVCDLVKVGIQGHIGARRKFVGANNLGDG